MCKNHKSLVARVWLLNFIIRLLYQSGNGYD